MQLHFQSAPKLHKPINPPETPFFRARQEWDNRIGTSVAQAKNWRIAFFINSAVSILLIIFLSIEISQAKVIPILVGIDSERGEPMVLGEASLAQRKIGDLEIKYFLSQFVRFVRGVPLDPVVIKQNWLRSYTFLRKSASGLLNEITNNSADSPLKKIGKVVVTVQPISIVKIPDTNSYQFRWRETVYSSSGSKEDEYTMIGTFSIEIETPTDAQTLQENPLGIFIKNFQWNREL